VMSMHKLTAGSGYDYLTRQVARNDSTVPGTSPLADYYDEKGESPGVWVGSGLAGIDGLAEGDTVTAEQISLHSRQPAQGRRPPCEPSPRRGATAAAMSWGWLRPRLPHRVRLLSHQALSPCRAPTLRRLESRAGRPKGRRRGGLRHPMPHQTGVRQPDRASTVVTVTHQLAKLSRSVSPSAISCQRWPGGRSRAA